MNHVSVRLYKRVVTAHWMPVVVALVGPRCRLEALRAGSIAPGRLWSWETTLSRTLNFTKNVEACWTGEPLSARRTGIRRWLDAFHHVLSVCFVRVLFLSCIYFRQENS